MGWGGWDDPRARATRGLRKPSLDARSWDHPSHPVLMIVRCGLVWEKARLGASGWAGEKSGLFEHPAAMLSWYRYARFKRCLRIN